MNLKNKNLELTYIAITHTAYERQIRNLIGELLVIDENLFPIKSVTLLQERAAR